MVNEELVQRNYVKDGKVVGEAFGKYRLLNLGSTTVLALQKAGFISDWCSQADYPFGHYKPPKRPETTKPDAVIYLATDTENVILAVKEMKSEIEFNTAEKKVAASEQGLFAAAVLGARIAIMSDGKQDIYINVEASVREKQLVLIEEQRSFNPGVLEDLLTGKIVVRNPTPLAAKVWQAVWHATKEEPKACLMTFVEIFILKFLSDNLPSTVFPEAKSFYELSRYDAQEFVRRYGKSQIEFYVQEIRPIIKQIFSEKTLVTDEIVLDLFGLQTIVSDTSVINGFAFLQSGETSLPTFNRTFLEILSYFQEFGSLSHIDPEFKLRLYESFLKRTASQAKLGQFFTPRNVVKAIVKMAQLDKLPEGSIVFDPAAGVGGFILEPLIEPGVLDNNITFENGEAKQRIKLIGADVDIKTNVLAKANTLIHLAEYVRDPHITMDALNQLMTNMHLLLNTNQHLGTLEHPAKPKVDVIMTNPPYVTQGSKIYKEEIAQVKGLKNGFDLRVYYDRCGLGLESLFLRYISGALKSGGRAFVIVPQGLLTRTETTTKEKILSECNLIASISLPRNTFFNTPQKTYILGLEKRHTAVDPRPDVFCALVSSIGESLDARRVPTPFDNTLDEIASTFIEWAEQKSSPENAADRVKLVKATEFSESDRWDVQRFWSDEELVALGAREPAVDHISFITTAAQQVQEIVEDLQSVRQEIEELESGATIRITLADEELFRVRRGTRVKRSNGDQNPGKVPVFSGRKDQNSALTYVSEEWAKQNNIPIEEKPIITVNANGYVGACFVRREKCIIHDDVMIIEVLNDNLDLDYLVQVLRGAIATGNYEYEAKLYSRVKELEVNVPACGDSFDLERQVAIADAFKRFDSLRASLEELGKWAAEVRISRERLRE